MRFIFIPAIVCLASCTGVINYPEGGYEYPKQVADKDTNFYYSPLRKKLSSKDSFNYAHEFRFYKAIDERNLSIRPFDEDIFRLVYEGFVQGRIVITITASQIIIKKLQERAYAFDDMRLTPIEKMHFYLLNKYFPISQYQGWKAKKYLDSMVKIYSDLLNPYYYQILEEKIITPPMKPFKYFRTIIPIFRNDFIEWVNLLNNSGFWKLPYYVDNGCEAVSDGNGLYLEANIKRKYNLVAASANHCPNDTIKFLVACQKLIEMAHLEKEISLIWQETKNTKPERLVVKDVQLEEIKEPIHKKSHRHRSK